VQYGFFTDEDFQQITPFTDRIVCLLGSFGSSTSSLKKRIIEFGATEVKTSVSRGIHYVVMGNDIPESQLSALNEMNFHGYYPKVLNRAEIDDVFAGHYAAYNTPSEIEKSLSLGIQHYNKLRVELAEGINSLYTREIYVSPATKMPQNELYQLLGNLGVYANNYIDDTTNLLLLPDASISHLQEGTVDETIIYIQNSYNALRTQNFTFQLISESEILMWLRTFEA